MKIQDVVEMVADGQAVLMLDALWGGLEPKMICGSGRVTPRARASYTQSVSDIKLCANLRGRPDQPYYAAWARIMRDCVIVGDSGDEYTIFQESWDAPIFGIKRGAKPKKRRERADVASGADVRVSRIRMGLTQAQVAKSAGVSRPTVIRLEKGGSCQEAKVRRIMRAVGLA